jgi:hypothetical protein
MANFGDMFSSITNFDFSIIIDKVYFFLGIFLIIAVIGGAIGGFLYLRSKKNNNKDMKTLYWWEQTPSSLLPISMMEVEEIIIPGTTLRVFYNKEKDLWLPRFTRGITPTLFYIAMTPNRQMVNFSMPNLNAALEKAELEIDHTDMLWAAENTREFIKRNFKDKSIKWWQAYQGVITTAIFILIMTFSLAIILYMMKGLVGQIGGLLSTANEAVKTSCANAFSSGLK